MLWLGHTRNKMQDHWQCIFRCCSLWWKSATNWTTRRLLAKGIKGLICSVSLIIRSVWLCNMPSFLLQKSLEMSTILCRIKLQSTDTVQNDNAHQWLTDIISISYTFSTFTYTQTHKHTPCTHLHKHITKKLLHVIFCHFTYSRWMIQTSTEWQATRLCLGGR